MEIQKIKLGMELKPLKKKNSFICEKIEGDRVQGRMIKKDGTIGKRVMKDEAQNITTAQTILGGCERNE